MEDYQYSLKKIDITPKNLQCLELGAYRVLRNNSQIGAVRDNIFLFIFRYKISEHEFCIITLDLLWIDEHFFQQLKREIEAKTNLKPANILICCTHTHSAPYVSNDFKHYGESNQDYNAYILKLLSNNINDFEYTQADSIVEGYFDAEGFISNRNVIVKRLLKKPLRVTASPNLKLIHENKIRYVKLTPSGRGKPTYLINFSCHPTFNKSNNITADFPGIVREYFEDKSANALFIQGYAGDQKINIPRYTLKSIVKSIIYLKFLPSFNESRSIFASSLANILSRSLIPLPPKTKQIADGMINEIPLSNGKQLRIQKMVLTKNINLMAINAEASYQLTQCINDISTWPVGYANGMIGYIPCLELIKVKAGYEYNSWSHFNAKSPLNKEDMNKIIKSLKELDLQ